MMQSSRERHLIIKRLEEAFRTIEKSKDFSLLVPAVGCNIVYALPNATDKNMVASLTGKVINIRGLPKACGDIDFGWAKYMSRAVIAAMRIDRDKRAAMCLRVSPEIVEACEDLGLDIVEFASKAPEEERMKKCLVPFELETLARVPQGTYDHGDVGVEALLILYGEDPVSLADLACKLARKTKEILKRDEKRRKKRAD